MVSLTHYVATTPPMITLCEQLLIVPTTLEQKFIQRQLFDLNQHGLSSATCGLGLVESTVSVARLISVHQPKQLWLIGIAGSLSDKLQLGQAYEFSEVSCYGIGVGSGVNYCLPSELGWEEMMKFGTAESLQLDGDTENLQLLSVTSSSANADEAELKRLKFPKAAAEDMEAYSIALLCKTQGIRFRVIRGISNWAGDREHAHWQVAESMMAAIELCSSKIKIQS